VPHKSALPQAITNRSPETAKSAPSVYLPARHLQAKIAPPAYRPPAPPILRPPVSSLNKALGAQSRSTAGLTPPSLINSAPAVYRPANDLQAKLAPPAYQPTASATHPISRPPASPQNDASGIRFRSNLGLVAPSLPRTAPPVYRPMNDLQAKFSSPAYSFQPMLGRAGAVSSSHLSGVVQMVGARLLAGTGNLTQLSNGGEGLGKTVSDVGDHAERKAWRQGMLAVKKKASENLNDQLNVEFEVDAGICTHCQVWFENVLLGTLHRWDVEFHRLSATKLFVDVNNKRLKKRVQVVRGTTDWDGMSYSVSIRDFTTAERKKVTAEVYDGETHKIFVKKRKAAAFVARKQAERNNK
jgi:hypothetical protein